MNDVQQSWMYLILSALVYGASFVSLEALWWSMLFWPFIMWYGGVYIGFSNFQGFCWALVVIGLQVASMMHGVYGLASGSAVVKICCIAVWIALMALPGLIWFSVVNWLIHCTSSTMDIVWWCVTTWLYLLWMEYGCLSVCGTWCGYSLISPLIPLNQSECLWPLYFLGRPLFLAIWLGLSAWILFCWIFNKRMFLCASVISTGIMIWCGKSNDIEVPQWVEHLGVVRSCFLLDEGPEGALAHCARHIKKLYEEHPHITCILMSESSFYHPAIIDRWQELAQRAWVQDVACPVIFGGYRLCDQGFYNTAALIHGSCVLATYYKSHATPFIEKIPLLFRSNFIKKLFNKAQGELVLGDFVHPVWEIMPGVRVVPYICSELFCAARQLDDHHDIPIVALCNSRWAPQHMEKLMFEGARLRALEWNREIIFIAQGRASWCSPQGTVKALTCESLYC
jgi:hypothetical protein